MTDHYITETRSPVAVIWRCSCGWSHRETRRQNALARAAKLRAAANKHKTTLNPEDRNLVTRAEE
jgi:hypothetical protein